MDRSKHENSQLSSFQQQQQQQMQLMHNQILSLNRQVEGLETELVATKMEDSGLRQRCQNLNNIEAEAASLKQDAASAIYADKAREAAEEAAGKVTEK